KLIADFSASGQPVRRATAGVRAIRPALPILPPQPARRRSSADLGLEDPGALATAHPQRAVTGIRPVHRVSPARRRRRPTCGLPSWLGDAVLSYQIMKGSETYGSKPMLLKSASRNLTTLKGQNLRWRSCPFCFLAAHRSTSCPSPL